MSGLTETFIGQMRAFSLFHSAESRSKLALLAWTCAKINQGAEETGKELTSRHGLRQMIARSHEDESGA